MLVVDASAFASWVFPDEGGDKVSQALVRVMTEEESATSASGSEATGYSSLTYLL